jgi:hypothetical protein
MKVEIQRLPDWKHMQTGNYAWMAYVGVGYEGHVSMWEEYVGEKYDIWAWVMWAQDLDGICEHKI